MKTKSELKPLVVAVSTALAAGAFGISAANADESPFQMTELSSGYMVTDAQGEAQEGVAEEEKTKEGKCGEGKCGGEEADADASGEDKTEEGKCGEGKCGGS